MNPSTICLLDTSVTSKNMGDHIIVDSIKRILEHNLPSSIFVNVATHDFLSSEAYKVIENSNATIVCGTNLLCGNLESYKQWKIRSQDFLLLRDVVLMGVGWWQYQESISNYTSSFYDLCLSKAMPHSVRDDYTCTMLKKAVPDRKILNTACPTMWTLNRAHVANINVKAKSSSAKCVTTITDYKADPARDIKMLNNLLNHYESVHIWIQGAGDLSYIKSLERELVKQLQYISPTLSAYDRFLQKHERIDFIGTRLHAGIRALQWGHPATIVEVDNRAKEISRDTGLATWPRTADFGELVKHHSQSYHLAIALPEAAINAWIDAIKEIAIS